jgi:endonuclease YncB( thermonuclease family)
MRGLWSGAFIAPWDWRHRDKVPLSIGDAKVRLQGIDAPETDQICLDAHASKWTCGLTPRDRLMSQRRASCDLHHSFPADCGRGFGFLYWSPNL